MKIIPKLQEGGFTLYFTTYVPYLEKEVKLRGSSEKRTAKSTNDSEDKGELTLKDLFNMIKEIDGLPNDMNKIISSLYTTFMAAESGDLSNIALTYLTNLYKIKVASLNKVTFDKVRENAINNGSINDVAISPLGAIIVQDSEGKFESISAEKYLNNRDYYTPLTVSEILELRRLHPSFANDTHIFNIVNSSIGFEGFLKLIDTAKLNLGYNEYSTTNVMASKGLQLLEGMSEEDRLKVLEAISADSTLGSTYNTNYPQIKSFITYLITTLPKNAKVWASLQTGITDPIEASKALVTQYLLGSVKNKEIYKESTNRKGKSGSKNGSSSSEDPKYGFWSQVQTGTIGTPLNIVISPKEEDFSKSGFISSKGTFLGTTPGLDKDKSLLQYISDSEIGYLIKNPKNITFGDKQISENGFNNIVVNASLGASIAILPITDSGSIDFNLLDEYTSAMNKLESSNLDPDSHQYKEKLKEIFSSLELDHLIDSSGNFNLNKFGKFLILLGVANSNTKLIQNNELGPITIDDIESKYIIDKSDDLELKDITKAALSSKELGSYDIDNFHFYNPFDWGSSFYTHFYKANIYIPISENRNSAMLADENQVKESTMYDFELSYLKLQKLKDTSSKQ